MVQLTGKLSKKNSAKLNEKTGEKLDKESIEAKFRESRRNIYKKATSEGFGKYFMEFLRGLVYMLNILIALFFVSKYWKKNNEKTYTIYILFGIVSSIPILMYYITRAIGTLHTWIYFPFWFLQISYWVIMMLVGLKLEIKKQTPFITFENNKRLEYSLVLFILVMYFILFYIDETYTENKN